jgi:hypothetical protein
LSVAHCYEDQTKQNGKRSFHRSLHLLHLHSGALLWCPNLSASAQNSSTQ